AEDRADAGLDDGGGILDLVDDDAAAADREAALAVRHRPEVAAVAVVDVGRAGVLDDGAEGHVLLRRDLAPAADDEVTLGIRAVELAVDEADALERDRGVAGVVD